MENNRLCSCYRLSSLSAFGVRNQLPHWEGLCLDRDERDIERQTQTHTERSTWRERLCSDRRALYKALCSLFYNNDSEIMFVPRMKSWRSRFSRCSASVYAQRAFEERRRGRRERRRWMQSNYSWGCHGLCPPSIILEEDCRHKLFCVGPSSLNIKSKPMKGNSSHMMRSAFYTDEGFTEELCTLRGIRFLDVCVLSSVCVFVCVHLSPAWINSLVQLWSLSLTKTPMIGCRPYTWSSTGK